MQGSQSPDDGGPTQPPPVRADETAVETRTGPPRRTRYLSEHRRLRMALLIALGLIVSGFASFGIAYATIGVPAPSDLVLSGASAVTYKDGTILAKIGDVNRKEIPFAQMPKLLRDAVLAAEDRKYYSEPGISIRGTFRALVADVVGLGVKQGGSTITQQYVKNAYLTQKRTISRKLREVVMAVKLDQRYSKDQILGWYLNTIYFGRGTYGVEAASLAYFGVHTSALNEEQAVVLAGLIRSPARLDPAKHPKAAKARWQGLIQELAREGKISAATASKARFPAVRTFKQSAEEATLRPDLAYIRDAALAELVRHGVSEDRIAQGGLTITTTIDKATQDKAVAAVQSVTQGAPGALQEGLVAIEPGTGAIRASYGGGSYGTTQGAGPAQPGTGDFKDNVFYSTNPAGSSFKPIVLAAALKKGIGLDTRYPGWSPQQIPGTQYTGANALRNFNNEQFGSIDLITATQHSVNTVYVPLGIDAGLKSVVDTAHSMGIPDAVNLDQVPAISLGTAAVRTVDMGAVYSTFAARGQAHEPYLVLKATSRSAGSIYKHEAKSHEALSKKVADDATFAMQAVLNGGTGTAATLADARPAAGKTGTTTDNRAAWFCGFTPQLATAVSMFYDDGSQPLRGILGINEVTGGTLPAMIWKRFMDATLAGQPIVQFAGRGNVATTFTPPPPTSNPSASSAPTTAPTKGPKAPKVPVVQPSQQPSPAPPSSSPAPQPTPTDSPAPQQSPAAQPGASPAAPNPGGTPGPQ